MQDQNPFGETIYSYSRAQAIQDGVLVRPLVHRLYAAALESSHRVHRSRMVYHRASREADGQDLSGICHDISTMAKFGFKREPDANVAYFKVFIAGDEHTLKLHISPGDAGEPVLTLMLPNED